jgi:hypothetical protein
MRETFLGFAARFRAGEGDKWRMKSSISLCVVMCLVASPFAACATTHGPRQIDEALAYSGSPVLTWSRVGEIAAGAEIMVTTKNGQSGYRYFVMADRARLTVLNLTNPTLPAASIRILREMAAQHPENFVALDRTGTLAQNNVRLGRDGLFLADRKVADLAAVVETISPNDVSEIWGPVVARGSVLGTVLGGWLGFAVGVVPGLGGASDEVAWLALIGSIAVGGYLGFSWSSHETDGIVYKAP